LNEESFSHEIKSGMDKSNKLIMDAGRMILIEHVIMIYFIRFEVSLMYNFISRTYLTLEF